MSAAPQPPQSEQAEGAAAGGLRKNGLWLVVDPSGQTQAVETAGKNAIMRLTGLSAKYLRILDPGLSYPSTVLGRERAILVNLEHIKAIITAHEVMFLNFRHPLVTPFINNLQRIFRHRQALKAHQGNDERTQQVAEKEYGLKTLPFEFVALEACLDVACIALDNEASRLEQEAVPVLDKLTTLNSERVRQIQSRLVALSGRVQMVRDKLKLLLVDDEDMTKMCLTRKLEEQLDNSSIEKENLTKDEMIQGDRNSASDDTHIQERKNHMSGHSSTTKNLDVKELKMILQAYLAQTEGTLQKLSNLTECAENTEHYSKIMLDDKDNHNMQMGIMVYTATTAVCAFVAMTGVFGMNINIELFDPTKAGMHEFLWTVAGGTIACFVMFIAAIGWYKYKGLLE